MEKDWVATEIAFYDFMWEKGTELCGAHINQELMADFAQGGSLFQEMTQKLRERFPTREDAYAEYAKITNN